MLENFSLALGMMAFTIILGRSIFYFFEIFFKSSKTFFNDEMSIPYAALIGTLGISIAYTLLGSFGLLNLRNLLVVTLSIIFLSWIYTILKGINFRIHLKDKKLLPWWFMVFFVPILLIGFLVASLPTSNWDAISYVLTIPKLHIAGENLRYLDEYGIFSSFPIFGEAAFGIALLLNADSSTAQFFTYLFFPILLYFSVRLFACYSRSRLYLGLALLSVGYLPLVVVNLGIAKIEIIQACFLIGSTVLIIEFGRDQSAMKRFLSFLFLSFAFGLKYTAVFYFPVYLIFYAQSHSEFSFKRISKEIISLVCVGIGINLPWLGLNYLQHCNPVFPNLSELMGSCTYTSLQMQNISTMIKEATIWQNGTSWRTTHSLMIYLEFLTQALGALNIFVCIGACITMIIIWRKNWRLKIFYSFVTILLVLGWQFYYYYWEFRYFYPTLTVFIVLAWLIISQAKSIRWVKYLSIAFVCLQVIFSINQFKNSMPLLWLYAQNKISRVDFQNLGIHLYWVSQYINQNTQLDEVIAFNWGVQPFFYLNRDFFFIHDWNPEVGFEYLNGPEDFKKLLKSKNISMLAWRVQDDSRFPLESISRTYHDRLNQYLKDLLAQGFLKEDYRKDDVVIYRIAS